MQRARKWITNPKSAKDAWVEIILALGLHDEQRGFYKLPRRWVVERTFAWLNKFRRLSKDYEQQPETTNLYSILL